MKRVALFGDSIRLLGYNKVISKYLPDVEIYSPEDNSRFTKYMKRMIFECREELDKGFDVIHFNCGLWDITKLYKNIGIDEPFTPLDEYLKDLDFITTILLKHAKIVIFSLTTPVRKENEWNDNETIQKYNKAAKEMLEKKGIIINDLYSLLTDDINKYIREDDNIHLTDEGIIKTAKSVSSIIKRYL